MGISSLVALVVKVAKELPKHFKVLLFAILALGIVAATLLRLFPDIATMAFSLLGAAGFVILIDFVMKSVGKEGMAPPAWLQRSLLVTVVLLTIGVFVLLLLRYFFHWPPIPTPPRDVRFWGRVCTVSSNDRADTTWIDRAVVKVNGMDFYHLTRKDGGFDGILRNVARKPYTIDVFIDHEDYQSRTENVPIDRDSDEHFELFILDPLSQGGP